MHSSGAKKMRIKLKVVTNKTLKFIFGKRSFRSEAQSAEKKRRAAVIRLITQPRSMDNILAAL